MIGSVSRIRKPAILGGNSLRPNLSARIVRVAARAKRIPTTVRWLFLLFVFTIPFEFADLAFTSGSVSLAKITGLFFFAFYFFFHNPLTRKRSLPSVSPAMWWFGGYVGIYALNGIFIPEEFAGAFFSRFLSLVQLVVLFWIASDLLKEEKLATSFLLTYSAASVIVALGMILQLPGFSVVLRTGGRITSLGYHPNNLAAVMALATVMLLGLFLNSTFRNLIGKISLIVLTLPLFAAIVSTGSRTAIVALMIGALPYLLLQSRRRMTAVALVIVAMVTLVYIVGINPVASSRWSLTYWEGHTSGRDRIIFESVEMISEKPILGWQPVKFLYELGRRNDGELWMIRDAHNLYLHLLLEVGIVGAVPFLVGLWLCVRGAWKRRTGDLGLIPLALLLTILSINFASTGIARKPMWLVLALALAAGTVATKQVSRSGFAK